MTTAVTIRRVLATNLLHLHLSPEKITPVTCLTLVHLSSHCSNSLEGPIAVPALYMWRISNYSFLVSACDDFFSGHIYLQKQRVCIPFQ